MFSWCFDTHSDRWRRMLFCCCLWLSQSLTGAFRRNQVSKLHRSNSVGAGVNLCLLLPCWTEPGRPGTASASIRGMLWQNMSQRLSGPHSDGFWRPVIAAVVHFPRLSLQSYFSLKMKFELFLLARHHREQPCSRAIFARACMIWPPLIRKGHAIAAQRRINAS